MLISCCVNTYKRPILLKKLLLSLEKQKLEKDWKLEIIIVDNDELEQGKLVVEEFRKCSNLNIHYYTQPIKNISVTRNKGVKFAKGEIIMFIDDDGFAAEDWIFEMMKCMENYEADAVFGTVLPYYEEGVPELYIKGKFFDRLIQNTGEPATYKRTTNCLIKSVVLKQINGPFDPKDGLTGGEDSNLFEKLRVLGAKLVFCKEGIVHDHVPINRANLKWLIQRKFREGLGFTAIKLKHANRTFLTGFYYFLRAIIFLFISFVLFLVCFPFKIQRTKWLLNCISNIGHLSAFAKIEYREYE
ncbi:glycosyltransferase [Algoriphagus sp. NG3]|uniref:glycosyltransferase n=1 Tax=Algoriphagus sp. NG3 TaxID=3097546 RepID=UPI002A8097B6|nr:glycosyltransferase [Algoriphagus sp. NG3]WPR73546.1 glycosyltransferase [Algoriphagus sp. NG3]